jgi:two-component system, chemotaxis family, chemotaxis protein CheY
MQASMITEEGNVTVADRVNFVVVDDSQDIRLLVRMTLEGDGRFSMVGEAVDGLQGIDVVTATQPDLVILDRQMPRMGGVEALPAIRAGAPRAAVVLYTANSDQHTCQAAFAAGAASVLEKVRTGQEMVEHLAGALVAHWVATDADCDVRVGPVDGGAAQVWVANSKRILDAVRAHPDVLERPLEPGILDDLDAFLQSWAEVAAPDTEFVWAGKAPVEDVRRVVEAWATIDRIPDDALAAIGCSWAPPEGAAFFEALTAGVLDALQAHDKAQRLAARLSRQWRGDPVVRGPRSG